MAFRVLPDANLGQMIVAQNMATDIVSDWFKLRDRLNAAITLVWTGNPVGPFSLQVSNDHVEDDDGNVQDEGTPQDIPLSANIAAAGVADDAYIELDGLSAPYIRVVYAAVSGVGVLDAFISAKPGNPT